MGAPGAVAPARLTAAGGWLLRVQVLGEVRAWRGDDPIALGPASRRAMLGLLALAGGQPLARTDLVAGVWHGRPPPPSAVNVLHTHVKHLRRLLEPERPPGAEATVVRRVGEGYALHVTACTVDVVQFRVEVATAAKLRRDGRLHEALALLDRALSRWQGQPLADVPALAGHPKLIALAEERQSVLGRYGDMMIAAGRASDVIAALEEEAAARPLDEAAQARLILAYRGVGRRDRAFATYHAARKRLADDLGVDPGPELKAVHAELLHDARPTVTIPETPRPAPTSANATTTSPAGAATVTSPAGAAMISPAGAGTVTGPAGAATVTSPAGAAMTSPAGAATVTSPADAAMTSPAGATMTSPAGATMASPAGATMASLAGAGTVASPADVAMISPAGAGAGTVASPADAATMASPATATLISATGAGAVTTPVSAATMTSLAGAAAMTSTGDAGATTTPADAGIVTGAAGASVVTSAAGTVGPAGTGTVASMAVADTVTGPADAYGVASATKTAGEAGAADAANATGAAGAVTGTTGAADATRANAASVTTANTADAATANAAGAATANAAGAATANVADATTANVADAATANAAGPATANAAGVATANVAGAGGAVGAGVTPAQLIGDLPVFAGRAAELSLLDSLLDPARHSPATNAAPVAVVSGSAGMGKTSLAVHWAHRVARHFPDGQLYVNLRGFHPGGAPMDPSEALRRFLDALGVAGGQMPADLDALAALYRSRLAGRRVLVLLDNAADVAQVRPLLPGRSSCLAVVTSRNQLAGLVAAEGAWPVSLNPLAPAEARQLLVRRMGADRAAAEPEAVREIVQRCAGLPLALTIFAARAVIGGGHPLQAYADELRPADGRLDALAVGDSDIDLREVFSWSYLALGDLPARLFRLLGMHPGPDISAAAVASLVGQPLARTRAALAELVSASLVLMPVPGRYALHDLVRAYASELAQSLDPAHSRRAAARRMLAHYVHTGIAADRLLNPTHGSSDVMPGALPPGVTPERYDAGPRALSWFDAERAVLLAVLDHAVAAKRDTETWQLARTLWTYLDRQGHWLDLATASHAAIAAAGRAAGPGVQADAYRMLARAYTRLNRLEDARTQLHHALELYQRVGDRNGQANTHLNTALVWERQGDYGRALDHARTALDLYVMEQDRAGQARARNSAGWYHALMGDHAQALAQCQAALTDSEALGDRRARAPVWDSVGYAHHKLGHHAQAVACIQHAVDLYRELGDRHLEGLVLCHLAEAQQAAGDTRQARVTWRQALAILTELDAPAAEQVRIALAGLPGSPAAAGR